ncbi:hypothetical protein GM418_21270 [Maribellus comscasis]|uniref:Uncharacterized protein n=1 Tax=Maribellus comscasis TaxID=2681766 RepID=A0A6I6JSR3_9BACT|nr:hypothetical protein [Maribellus comscasis]QGY46105.1 hypothetical protein GM418_21270 [Maribellus comscasis]
MIVFYLPPVSPLELLLQVWQKIPIYSGIIAAEALGSLVSKSVLRICIWGTIAMAMSALIGYLFGVGIN